MFSCDNDRANIESRKADFNSLIMEVDYETHAYVKRNRHADTDWMRSYWT